MARFLRCQFIIATHSPFMLGTLNAKIYNIDTKDYAIAKWSELENVRYFYNFFKENEKEFLQFFKIKIISGIKTYVKCIVSKECKNKRGDWKMNNNLYVENSNGALKLARKEVYEMV